MAYHADGVEANENLHLNYEPSTKTDSLRKTPRTGKAHTTFVSGNVVRQKIGRQNNYEQAGARYRTMEDSERDELISNLVNLVGQCNRDIQERVISRLSQRNEEYGRRVAEGLGILVGERPTAHVKLSLRGGAP